MENWTLLTSHAQVLLAIARDPGMRLRDIAAILGITERSAYAIVTDLTEAGYVAKQKDGRRNRYQIQAHLPLPGPASQRATIGELLCLLTSRPEATEHSGQTHRPASPRRGTPPQLVTSHTGANNAGDALCGQRLIQNPVTASIRDRAIAIGMITARAARPRRNGQRAFHCWSSAASEQFQFVLAVACGAQLQGLAQPAELVGIDHDGDPAAGHPLRRPGRRRPREFSSGGVSADPGTLKCALAAAAHEGAGGGGGGGRDEPMPRAHIGARWPHTARARPR